MNKAAIIELLIPPAVSAGRKYNVPPELLIAQAILESGWLKSSLSKAPYYNLTGMKVGSGTGIWSGQSVNMSTAEVIDGQNIIIKDNFRIYDNYRQSLEDTAHRHVVRFKLNFQNDTVPQAIDRVAASGYATSPAYASALKSIYNQYLSDIPFHKITPTEKKTNPVKTIAFAGIGLLLIFTAYEIVQK